MEPAVLREDMVDGLEHAMDLSEAVATAMRTVPREAFVSERPYDNRRVVHEGTTVLSPRTAARLLDALAATPGDEVLVVGAGVGYTAAVLAEIVGERQVHAVDITRRVVLDARQNLRTAGYDGVLVDCRDGASGFAEYAPFDRILVEAAAVRPPRALVSQLSADGRLVMPMGGPEQTLVAVEPGASRRSSGGRLPTGGDRSPTDPVAGSPVAAQEEYTTVAEFGSVTFRPLLVDGEQSVGPVRNRTEREDREFARQGYFAPTGWEHDWIDWDRQP
jgi:protein-L-isoaspartate(D-aspartate) O-methyltransferase